MQHPVHLQAKRQQAKWLATYQIVIGQVLRTYGDGGIAHPLSAPMDEGATPASNTERIHG